MSTPVIGRRRFLTYPLFFLLSGPLNALAELRPTVGSYAADIRIFYDMLSLELRGSIEEFVDRPRGQYRITARGRGRGIENHVESSGVLRSGRWTPLRTESSFDVRGRHSRLEIAYDWAKRHIEYHARAETFFMRRLRVVDDVLPVPDWMHVDDVMSAALNFADGRWPAEANGVHRTFVVRRRRADNERPDDVASSYKAETVPLDLRIISSPSSESTGLFDLSRFSSWAKPSEPARIVFSENRRPQVVETSLILGTSVTIRFSAI